MIDSIVINCNNIIKFIKLIIILKMYPYIFSKHIPGSNILNYITYLYFLLYTDIYNNINK